MVPLGCDKLRRTDGAGRALHHTLRINPPSTRRFCPVM